MPLVGRPRYKMNNASFGEMMVSSQTRDVAVEAAREIAALATANQRLPETPYEVDEHPPDLVLGGNPRAIAHVVGPDRLHAVEEFGSGVASQGETAGLPRPQGGHSPARRTLAHAGNAVVPQVTRVPE